MLKKTLLLTLISSVLFLSVHAAEIDSVTPRKVKLENSLASINTIFNKRIQEGVDKANGHKVYIEDIDLYVEGDNYCDKDVLYSELRKAIYQSYTASWGLKGYDLDLQLRNLLAMQSYSLSLNDSIYRDIDYIEGFSLNLKELSDVVNINGYLIGLDKLGHFFAEGWQYFELTHFNDYSIEQAVAWGKQQEAGKYGYSTTGIFSFADLVANYNGWRFWNRVLLEKDDPLKGVIANFLSQPYISCDIQVIESIKNLKIIRAWEFNNKFDLTDYLDGTWDEGNNCNSYADPIIEAKVASRIKNVDPYFSCPLSAADCLASKEKYGYFAKYLLHPFCLIATDN